MHVRTTVRIRELVREVVGDAPTPRLATLTVEAVEDLLPGVRARLLDASEVALAHGAVLPLGPPGTPWARLHVARPGAALTADDVAMLDLVALIASLRGAAAVDPSAPGTAAAGRRLSELVMDVLEGLDAMPDAAISRRLDWVASEMAAALDAAAWFVSHTDGENVVEATRGLRRWAEDPGTTHVTTHALRSYPVTLEATRGAAFYADRTSGPMSERRFLAQTGFHAVIGAGGYDPDARGWLVELFTDERSAEPSGHAPLLLALVQCALSFPRPTLSPLPDEDAFHRIPLTLSFEDDEPGS